jgi:redox-sensitive bicupin YhaK (pirin superfamily)
MSSPLLIKPRHEDVVGQSILRALPSAKCRSVGPFVFFDHMLEARFAPGSGMNINQHPHIGLSTLTYLFDGQVQHKDSLGSDQRVLPGDVSWMTAGRGIAHVERTPADVVHSGSSSHGLQVWLAMPAADEQGEPSYSHHPASSLPRSSSMGVDICLIAGHGFCLQSPVPVLSPTLYAELRLATGATLQILAEHAERALYLIDGEALVDDQALPPRQLLVLPEGEEFTLSACTESHLVIIGGAPIGPRRINWNFVASEQSLIDQARLRWSSGDWPQVPGEHARIDLPR